MAAFLIVFSHRPDAILNPQFWAEDGAEFYAEAHNVGGWSVLFHPGRGYLHMLPRLTAATAQMVPLAAAPLFFNLIAIFFQVLPVNFFLSSRFSELASLRTRFLLSFLYLALPNSYEIDANITNVQWHVAVLLFLVFMAAPPKSISWRCFDLVIVCLGSLTGPFGIFLLPIAGAAWASKRRERWALALLVILAVGAVIQLFTLVKTGAASGVSGLSARPLLLARILAAQVFLGSIVGKNSMPYCRAYAVLLTALGGVAIVPYTLWNARREVKLFIVFAAIVLAASLLDSTVPAPKWPHLVAWWNIRYWFIPMLAFVAAWVWMAGDGHTRFLRFAAIAILLLMTIGIVRDWRYPPFIDFHFRDYAHRYSDLPSGSSLDIPLNPTVQSGAPEDWSMTLIKR